MFGSDISSIIYLSKQDSVDIISSYSQALKLQGLTVSDIKNSNEGQILHGDKESNNSEIYYISVIVRNLSDDNKKVTITLNEGKID